MARMKTTPRVDRRLLGSYYPPTARAQCQASSSNAQSFNNNATGDFQPIDRDELLRVFKQATILRERSRLTWIEAFQDELDKIRRELDEAEAAMRISPKKTTDKGKGKINN